MPVRRDVPGRLRAADPGPHDILPVPQAPAHAGRAGGGPVLPGAVRVRVRGAAADWASAASPPATGSRSPRMPRRRRTGPRPGCGSSPRRSSPAPARPPPPRRRKGRCCRGTDLLLGGDAVPPRPDPRSRAGRVLAYLEDLEGEREAAEAEAREQGQAYLQALAAGTADGRPPAAVALAAQQLRVEKLIAAQEAAVAAWEAGRAGQAPPGRGWAAARQARRTLPGSARPAPGWRNCGHGPPRRRRPPQARTGRSRSRGATPPTRTPG